jgi:hypothetical protein
MKTNRGWIEAAQRNWIFQVIEEQTTLMWNTLERDCFDAQT